MAHAIEYVDSPEPIQQADIVVSIRDPVDARLIVTADCDIVKSKSWGRLQWIPLVPAISYVASRSVIDDIEMRVRSHQEEISKKVIARCDAAGIAYNSQAVEDAIAYGDVEGLAEYCSAPASDITRWRKIVDAIAAVKAGLDTLPIRHSRWDEATCQSAFSLLKTFCEHLGTAAPGPQKFHSQLKTAKDDAFLLTHEQSDELMVALLRFVDSIPESDVSPQIGIAQRLNRPYYRVARVLQPYRYELTRMLGQVFSGIGLPESFERLRDEHLERIKQRLGAST